MGFPEDILLGLSRHPPNRKPVTFIARDEKEVRRTLQRAFHRPKDEAWAKSILRIRSVHRKRIGRWLALRKIDDRTAGRMRSCTPPNSPLAKAWRTYCGHPACPYCVYRRRLALYRQLWHGLCSPELDERQEQPLSERRGRTRLALGKVFVSVGTNQNVEARVRQLLDDRVIRKIQRAGRIRDGVATVSVHHSKQGYSIHLAVLGLTDRPVQHSQPQGPSSRGKCDVSTAWAIKWATATMGYDTPKFGPASLLKLLCRALPVALDDTELRIKRIQPLGRCRQFVRVRPVKFPRPIRYRSLASIAEMWHGEKDQLRGERLDKYVARVVLRRICRECGILPNRDNLVIGRFFKKCQEATDLMNDYQGVVDLKVICSSLEMPIVFFVRHHWLNELDGFVPPASKGGWIWQEIVSQLDVFGDADHAVGFAMRPPAKRRGAVVVHRLPNAAEFGRAEHILGCDAYVQHLDKFLDYVMDVWFKSPGPEHSPPPRDLSDLLNRAP